MISGRSNVPQAVQPAAAWTLVKQCADFILGTHASGVLVSQHSRGVRTWYAD